MALWAAASFVLSVPVWLALVSAASAVSQLATQRWYRSENDDPIAGDVEWAATRARPSALVRGECSTADAFAFMA
jgi:hypothetical protein